MPEIPDVSAIAQQVKARIKHIEDQLKRHHVLTDELDRLRAALVRLGRSGPIACEERPAQPQTRASPDAQRCARARGEAGTRAAGAEQGQGARRAQGRTDDCFGDREGHRYRHRHREHDAHQDGQDWRAGQSRARLQAPAIGQRRWRRLVDRSSLTRPPSTLRACRNTARGGLWDPSSHPTGLTIGLPILATRRPPRAKTPAKSRKMRINFGSANGVQAQRKAWKPARFRRHAAWIAPRRTPVRVWLDAHPAKRAWLHQAPKTVAGRPLRASPDRRFEHRRR
jgi:hypothetical protein